MNSSSERKPSVERPWLKYYSQDAIDAAVPVCSLYDYIYNNNRDYLDGVAINYFGREISFRQFFANVQKTAQAYAALGVKKDDVVILCAVTTPEIVYTFYALDLLGAIPNMVDPRYSVDGIREYIAEVNCKVVYTMDVVYDKVGEAVKGTDVEKVVVVSPADSLPAGKRFFYDILKSDKVKLADNCVRWKDFMAGAGYIALPSIEDRPHKCCAIVHTGGTTGTSKCVMLCDDNYNNLAFEFGHCKIKFERGQRFLNVMPPFIAYGFGVGVHLPLASGVTCVIVPQLQPEQLGALLLRYKPAHMAGVPAHYQILMKDKKMKGKDLSYMINTCAGGDGISVPSELAVNDFLAEHGCKYPLTKGYGMTEVASAACACMSEINKPGSVGVPMLKTTVGIFDPETGEELGYNEHGEICISTPTMMLGYMGLPEETAKVIRTHSDGRVWVHTGDIGYMDEEGYVFLDARIKRVIIRHDGFKVFPTLIENVIASHPAVELCAAVAMPDRSKVQGCLPIVNVVLKPNIHETREQVLSELEKLCSKELPEYVQPAALKFREHMPYTPIGKIDFRTLEDEICANIKTLVSKEAAGQCTITDIDSSISVFKSAAKAS